MYVVVLKDFSEFKAGDVLRQEEDKEWFKCDRAAEHIDVINALPEYYCKVEEGAVNCSCTKTVIAIDPSNGSDVGCCILAENEGDAIKILESVPLHVCKCQKFTEKFIDDYVYNKPDAVWNGWIKRADMIKEFLRQHNLLSN